MSETTIIDFPTPEAGADYLTQVLRDGARQLLAQAVEAEAAAFGVCSGRGPNDTLSASVTDLAIDIRL